MAFRLTEGKGEAFYELGVHDNGEVVGIEQEEIFESVLVLFHISSQIEAALDITKVRLGPDGYSVQLKVTDNCEDMVDQIEPTLDGFFTGLQFLDKTKMYDAQRR